VREGDDGVGEENNVHPQSKSIIGSVRRSFLDIRIDVKNKINIVMVVD
jgi:hypothetical protein